MACTSRAGELYALGPYLLPYKKSQLAVFTAYSLSRNPATPQGDVLVIAAVNGERVNLTEANESAQSCILCWWFTVEFGSVPMHIGHDDSLALNGIGHNGKWMFEGNNRQHCISAQNTKCGSSAKLSLADHNTMMLPRYKL